MTRAPPALLRLAAMLVAALQVLAVFATARFFFAKVPSRPASSI
jgi:hypothetical protein